MNAPAQALTDLHSHQALCRELLVLAERESQALRLDQPEGLKEVHHLRRLLLPRLHESLANVRRLRLQWQQLSPAERSGQPEIQFLIRQVQDLVMRILVLDRENEQGLLRRGLIPPREMAAAWPQRPQVVADLYRRQVS